MKPSYKNTPILKINNLYDNTTHTSCLKWSHTTNIDNIEKPLEDKIIPPHNNKINNNTSDINNNINSSYEINNNNLQINISLSNNIDTNKIYSSTYITDNINKVNVSDINFPDDEDISCDYSKEDISLNHDKLIYNQDNLIDEVNIIKLQGEKLIQDLYKEEETTVPTYINITTSNCNNNNHTDSNNDDCNNKTETLEESINNDENQPILDDDVITYSSVPSSPHVPTSNLLDLTPITIISSTPSSCNTINCSSTYYTSSKEEDDDSSFHTCYYSFESSEDNSVLCE